MELTKDDNVVSLKLKCQRLDVKRCPETTRTRLSMATTEILSEFSK